MEKRSMNDETTASNRLMGATHILKKLCNAGYETYFAGGCVRDRLLGEEPIEYDIATAASPDEIKLVFPRAKGVGESFGVMLVRRNDVTYDVASFREDGPYSDNRHPDKIQFGTSENDAYRRDFTINGIFYDPIEDKYHDFVGGEEDIKNKLIRAIKNPSERIAEDHLRMLRAVRFAARFSFSIESETEIAIKKMSHGLSGISKDRIGEEVQKMLTHKNRGLAISLLQELGLDQSILNETNARTELNRVKRLPQNATYATAIAAWIIDRHSIKNSGDDVVQQWREQLMLTNKERDSVNEILKIVQQLLRWKEMDIPGRKRTAASIECKSAMDIVGIEDSVLQNEIQSEIAELEKTELAPKRLISGHDLLEAGVKPSAAMGELIESVYDAQLKGTIKTKNDAIELALTIYQDSH